MFNMKHSHMIYSNSETPTKSTEDNQAGIMTDTNNKNDTPSHIRYFNIPNELLDSMEEERLENYLSIPELYLKMYEAETTITYQSFSMYQVHTVDLMIFCVNICAPYYCIEDRARERIVCHSKGRSIRIIDSERGLKFGYTLVRSRGMAY